MVASITSLVMPHPAGQNWLSASSAPTVAASVPSKRAEARNSDVAAGSRPKRARLDIVKRTHWNCAVLRHAETWVSRQRSDTDARRSYQDAELSVSSTVSFLVRSPSAIRIFPGARCRLRHSARALSEKRSALSVFYCIVPCPACVLSNVTKTLYINTHSGFQKQHYFIISHFY